MFSNCFNLSEAGSPPPPNHTCWGAAKSFIAKLSYLQATASAADLGNRFRIYLNDWRGVPYYLHGVATIPGLCGEKATVGLRGRLMRESKLLHGTGSSQQNPLDPDAIVRGSIVLRLGTADFYHVDTMASKDGKKWLHSEADTTKDGTMRLWCRKLMLIDGASHRAFGNEVGCVLSFNHDKVVRLEADEAHTISRTPHKNIILYQEEKYLSDFAPPNVAQDRDRVYLHTFALKQLRDDNLDITSLPATGEALIRPLLSSVPSSVSPNFCSKLKNVLKAWKLSIATECIAHFS